MVALKENPLTVAEVNKYGSIVGGSTGAHSSGAGTIKFVDNTRYFVQK